MQFVQWFVNWFCLLSWFVLAGQLKKATLVIYLPSVNPKVHRPFRSSFSDLQTNPIYIYIVYWSTGKLPWIWINGAAKHWACYAKSAIECKTCNVHFFCFPISNLNSRGLSQIITMQILMTCMGKELYGGKYLSQEHMENPGYFRLPPFTSHT